MTTLAPGRYRVVLPIAQESIYANWELSPDNVSHYESGAGPRVVTLRRSDNGLFHAATEATYTFDVHAPALWPNGLPQPQPHPGDPYATDTSGAVGLVVGGVALGGLLWGAYKLLGGRRR